MTATPNIASHLAAMAQSQPDAPALMFVESRASDGSRVYATRTFAQLEEDANVIARGLSSLGIAPGTRVALCLRPGVDFFATTFALFKLGAVPVLIDPGIGMKNFGRCLDQATPAAFIGIPLAHAARRVLGWARKTARIHVTTGFFGGISLNKVRGLGRSAPPPLCAQVSDAAVLFTSGSTGPAKGVLYTHENFDAQIRALKWEYKIEPGERDLATFPLFGLFGPALGMTTIIPEMDFTRPGDVDPKNIIEPIQQLNITSLFGSPALIDRVGAWGVQNKIKLSSLKRVISAGAPVSPRVIDRFASMLSPGVQLFTPYGATESLPVCSIGSDEILGETGRMANAGRGVCVGRPVGDMTVRIIRISDGAIERWSDDLVLPVGEVGEIAVRGRVVTGSYYDRADATRRAKIADHAGGFWHRMGDVGYLDSQGRLWFCGRKSQRVRAADGDMFSMPVEGVFNSHDMVKRSALVGVGEIGHQRPVVCLELQPESKRVNRQVLMTHLLDLGARFDHTRGIRAFLVHPNFPVDIRHNAKIGREKLALWAARRLK